jgi:hypothetical protein
MGAAFSSSTVAANIAETVVDVLRQISTDGIDSVPPVSPLTDLKIKTNDSLLMKSDRAETLAKSEASSASGQ